MRLMALYLAILFFNILQPGKIDDEILTSYQNYREELCAFRKEFGGSYDIPADSFFLFGMGNRTKWIFKDGVLKNIKTGEIFRTWPCDSFKIVPNEYSVLIFGSKRKPVRITEDETGVWVFEKRKPELIPGTSYGVNLPEFSGYRYHEILKVLHQEILINIVGSKPLPNLLVYDKPWRRDAAMMAMCLKRTGNLDLIRSWFFGISDPYDHNNVISAGNPESEVDNLGETLYLISLFADKDYPIVPRIMEEVSRCTRNSPQGRYIEGRTDFQNVPVYQTKWLLFGMKQLGIDSGYTIPLIPDNYSSLFWWDFKKCNIEGNRYVDNRYPYLEWARDHFYGWKNGLISDRDYPLTWEQGASEADYTGMVKIDSVYMKNQLAVPHSWHAAEIFLYLTDDSLAHKK